MKIKKVEKFVSILFFKLYSNQKLKEIFQLVINQTISFHTAYIRKIPKMIFLYIWPAIKTRQKSQTINTLI